MTAEVDYPLRGHGEREAACRFLEDVSAGRLRVEGLTAAEHGIGLALDHQYSALELGLADLSVIILAHRFCLRRSDVRRA